MATINTNYASLIDHVTRMNPDGSIATIAEMLSQSNHIVEDMIWKEGNLPTGEQVVMRTGLPDVTWRLLNQGIPNSKSTTVKVTEVCASLEAHSQVDKDVVSLENNKEDFRLSEAKPFIERMNQELSATIFYGNNKINPERFTGLGARFSTIANAANGENIIDGGGVDPAGLTSIWCISWGEGAVYGIYPKGSQAGLQHHKDDAPGKIYDADGNIFYGYSDHFEWKCGIAVKDWRQIVRIANLDAAKMLAKAVDAPDLADLMVQVFDKFPEGGETKRAFYCNRRVRTTLMRQALDKSNAALSVQAALSQFGKPTQELMFLGIPIRLVDAISNTEGQVI